MRLAPAACELLFGAMLLASAGIAPAQASLVATRLDAANVVALAPGGVDATAGIGDFAFSNGVLCAVVSDSSRESDLAPFGGALVDLGPHPWESDAFVTVEVEGDPDATFAARLPGFTPFAFTNPVFVDADGDGQWTPTRPPRGPLSVALGTFLKATKATGQERPQGNGYSLNWIS